MSEYDTLLPMPSCRNLLTKAIAATHAPSIVPAGLTGSGGEVRSAPDRPSHIATHDTEEQPMAFSEETAARVQSLYRGHLEESFQGTLRFDPIRVELTRNQFDRDAFHVTVVYDGGHGLLDPAKLNRISSLMADRAADLGIEDTILESYVHHLEYTGQREFVEDPLEQAGDNSKRWQELLNIAREPLGRRDPSTGTELNLAVDRCYFAAYHALCHSNAQALAGRLRTRRPGDWSRVYMGMGEGIIVERLRQYRHQGPRPVRDFGATFAILQEHRDRAMERPGSTFLPSEVPGSSGGRRAPLWRWRP